MTDAIEVRQVICLRCGRRDLQRRGPDGSWFSGSCLRCGDGQSLYELRPGVLGSYKPGSYVGNGEPWDDRKLAHLASQGARFRGM